MGVLQDNLVLSTELIMYIGHRKGIRRLRFRALALRSDEGLKYLYIYICIIYIINSVNKSKLSMAEVFRLASVRPPIPAKKQKKEHTKRENGSCRFRY